jgi:hypothetical protein
VNHFRYALGDRVCVREDLCVEYHRLPDEKGEVVTLTLNRRGTFATVDFGNGRRSIIDERGLVRSNKPALQHVKVPA